MLWREIMSVRENEIREKMQEAYKGAHGFRTDSFEKAVVLFEDGSVENYTFGQNDTLMSVWNGSAIQVAAWKMYDISEMDSYVDYLTSDQLAEYTAWWKAKIMEKYGFEDVPDTADLNDEDYLEEWNKDLYFKIRDEMKSTFIANYMAGDIDFAWDNRMDELGRQEEINRENENWE